MSALTKFLRKRREKQAMQSEPDSMLYRTISMAAILGSFVIAGLLVLAITKVFAMNSTIFGLLGTLGFLCIGCLLILPWIKKLEKGEFKKTSIVFLCCVGVCVLLWIISLWMGVGIYNKIRDGVGSDKELFNTLNFVKGTLIVSLQFMVVSVVATCATRYQKTLLLFQGITYLSYAYLDFYFTFFLACVQINYESKKIGISDSVSFLGNRFVITILILALVYVVIANAIMKRVEMRKSQNAMEEMYKMSSNIDEYKEKINSVTQDQPQEKTVEERLAELKTMLDKELITKEEYEKKKEEILKDI